MDFSRVLENLGIIFYIASPNRTSFEKIEDVPNYYLQSAPFFVAFIVLEQCVLRLMKKPVIRINDGLVSASQGIIYEAVTIFFYTWRFVVYTYIYNNWRILDLPWNSAWTWWICFILIDFLYYWTHRASHEINILWAAHQVHHSSEEFNLSTGLRQSAVLNSLLWIFYMPMALAIPPSVYLVHSYFNMLYQFWIHTQTIKSLGPLEYVLNTASHHRVHHGRNRYCIDKNYAGVLIIWDRIFGTFQAENEEVVYGLTHPINSFELIHIQFCHFKHIWKQFHEMKGWRNKLSVIFKGPGWSPGKPWHGNLEDIPEVKAPVEKYNPQISWWATLYILFHMLLLAFIFDQAGENYRVLPDESFYGSFGYIAYSLITVGIFLENRPYASWMELTRCVMYLALDSYLWPYTGIASQSAKFQQFFLTGYRLCYIASGIFWLTYCLKNVKITLYSGSKKTD